MSFTALPDEFFSAMVSIYTSKPTVPRRLLIKKLKAFVKEHDDCKDGWLMLGDLTLEDERLRYFEKALALDPNDPEACVEIAYSMDVRRPNKERVLRLLRTALENLPGHRDEVHCLDTVFDIADQWGLKEVTEAAVKVGNKHLSGKSDWERQPQRYAELNRRLRRGRRR